MKVTGCNNVQWKPEINWSIWLAYIEFGHFRYFESHQQHYPKFRYGTECSWGPGVA